MTIVMFALIGAAIQGGTAYWICFSLFCVLTVIKAIMKIREEAENEC